MNLFGECPISRIFLDMLPIVRRKAAHLHRPGVSLLGENEIMFLLTTSRNPQIGYNYSLTRSAPIAQLDRASVFGTEGWEFEPLWVHFFISRS